MRAEQTRRVRRRALGRPAVLLLMSCSVFPDHAVLPGGGEGGGMTVGASGGEPNAGGTSGGASDASGGSQGGGQSEAGSAPVAGQAGMAASGGRANAQGGNDGAGTTSGGNGAGTSGTGGSASCAQPITSTIEAAADTYVSELPNEKKLNFGPSITLRVGGIADARGHALLAFDLTPLGAATNIVRATLRVRLAAPTASPETLFAYALAQPFVESQATWERFTQTSKWVTPGGDTAVSPTSSSLLAAGTAAGATVELELTSDVSAITRGQRPNNGWLLSVSDAEGALDLVARESAFADERPTLEVTACP